MDSFPQQRHDNAVNDNNIGKNMETENGIDKDYCGNLHFIDNQLIDIDMIKNATNIQVSSLLFAVWQNRKINANQSFECIAQHFCCHRILCFLYFYTVFIS